MQNNIFHWILGDFMTEPDCFSEDVLPKKIGKQNSDFVCMSIRLCSVYLCRIFSTATIHYIFTGKSVYVSTAVESRLRVVMGQVCNTISIFCKCSFWVFVLQVTGIDSEASAVLTCGLDSLMGVTPANEGWIKKARKKWWKKLKKNRPKLVYPANKTTRGYCPSSLSIFVCLSDVQFHSPALSIYLLPNWQTIHPHNHP